MSGGPCRGCGGGVRQPAPPEGPTETVFVVTGRGHPTETFDTLGEARAAAWPGALIRAVRRPVHAVTGPG